MEDKDSLIGKEIRGFKFSGGPGHPPIMNKYDGVIGKITSVRYDVIQIKFPNGNIWNYPYEEALNHLVVEEEQSIEEILNNIKNLTKDL